MKTQSVYDNYEIGGFRRCNEDEKDDRQYVETCDEADAQFWTLYGHIEGQGVEAIGNFSSREAAEEVFFRITGQPFTGSYQACQRLRLMHAAPRMLEVMEFVAADITEGVRDISGWRRLISAAIDEATASCPPWISAEPDIHALLASQRQIAHIWTLEDVQGIRPDLDADQAWEVLRAVDGHKDAEFGITWLTLEMAAEVLFGDAPETHDESEDAPPAARSPVEITEDEFDDRFPLLTNHLNPNASWALNEQGGCLFETYGEELEFARRQDPRTVWTLVDGDNSDQYLLSGFRIVNRIGYLVSTAPVTEGADIQVHIAMDGADDVGTDDESEA